MNPLRTVADYRRALDEGTTSAVTLAERFLAEARRLTDLRIVVALEAERTLADARAADERRARGEVRSPLDGVPITIKDAYDLEGWTTTYGTRFLKERAVADCEVVRRLREAGAVVAAKVNLHEIGLGATGVNPHTGTPRNPWDPAHLPGGSSSGSGAAVGLGLGPVSLGGDAGGSIRIPAALNGVVGLKATFGRVPKSGTAELCWSLDHIGPLAASVEDAALTYRILAGPHAGDAASLGQPARTDDAGEAVRGLRLGVVRDWWALADDDVRAACERTLEALKQAGAELVEVSLPSLHLVRPTLYTIMGCEGAAACDAYWRDHARDYGCDVQLLAGVGRRLAAIDYLKAQRLRTAIVAELDAALGQCDVLVSPMAACVAPKRHPAAERAGEVDDATTAKLVAYTFLGNLSGYPSISVPCGSGAGGLPVGFQVLGRAWDEATVLRLARTVERVRPAFAREPVLKVDLLDGSAQRTAA